MRSLFFALLLVILAIPAQAAFKGPGAVEGVHTVAQALKAADHTPCILEGKIIEKVVGHSDKYIFQDSTGTMTVEIDDKVFAGRDVTPAMTVRAQGKVDAEALSKNEVDVKHLEILSK